MAITKDIETHYKCPKCGISGPDMFVYQTRVSIKQPFPSSKPDYLDITGSTHVYACANCGHIVKNA